MVQVALSDLATRLDKLQRIGFSIPLEIGEKILPSIIGPVTRFNAEGKELVRRDLPMETAYVMIEWHWTEFHGRDEVERSRIVERSYQRYPREPIPPGNIELLITLDTDNNQIVTTNPTLYSNVDNKKLLHTINLFLEIFGECDIYIEGQKLFKEVQVKRLVWDILPRGEYPWERLEPIVRPIINKAKEGKKQVLTWRLEKVGSYKPNFVAVGRNGFSGYVIFGFPNKNLFVLESAWYGNATYVLDHSWAEISQLTKAEILNNNLHRDRIIHRATWEEHIEQLLG